jgi:hypothetical protein
MAWRLWKTEKRQDKTRSWPSDTHESIKQLLEMYLRSDAAPFAGWAAPGVTFTADVEPVLRNGVRGYQLALWFWLFAEKHGTIAARMARESFCLLAEAAQPSSGDRIDTLLDFENRLAHSVEEISSGERKFRVESFSVELPMEFFLATGFLRLSPESPYAEDENASLQGNDYKLADCFRHATDEALHMFRPMIDEIDFDAKSLPNWKWSTHPGAAERHLQRRHSNPLFPLHRQMVTAHDVYEARLDDARALHEVSNELGELSQSFAQTTELPLNWQSYLEGYRDYVDRLDERRLAAGGQNAALGEAIARLRSEILTTWRTSLHKNRHSLATLDQEEAQSSERRALLYGCDWTAQLLSNGSLILPEEVVPALLSESPSELEKVVVAVQAEPRLHETFSQCRATAHRLVSEFPAGGRHIPDIDDKLRILDGTPGQVPA